MDMRNRQQSCRNKVAVTRVPIRKREILDVYCVLITTTLLPVSHVHYGNFIACFSCPLRRLYCLFLISITATIAWFSSPLDLTIWKKSAFLGLKGGSNEFFTYEYKRHRPAPRLWAVFSRAAPRAAPRVAYLVKICYFSPLVRPLVWHIW